MRHFYIICLSIICLSVPSKVVCQDKHPFRALLISGSYGLGLPAAALADRFEEHSTLGSEITLVYGKWMISGGYKFIFGNGVTEDPLSNLRTIEGGVIGEDMQFANVLLRERGHLYYTDAGFFFGKSDEKALQGWYLRGGAGFLQHKIRIVDDFGTLPQLLDPYIKGYDRLRGGMCLVQQLGYQYLSHDKMVNFYVSIQGVEAFTKDLRRLHYNGTDSMPNGLDVLINVQVGWVVPLYLKKQQRYY